MKCAYKKHFLDSAVTKSLFDEAGSPLAGLEGLRSLLFFMSTVAQEKVSISFHFRRLG